MKLVVRAAIGCVLLSMASPTVSLADVDPHNAMNHFNSKNNFASAGSARTSRSRAARTSRTARKAPNTRTFARAARTAPAARTLARAARTAPIARTHARAFAGTGAGSPHWVNVAQQYKGTNPTKRKSLWCADFMNLVLQRSGMKGTSSSMAKSFIGYGQRLSGPKVGAIAVISRGRSAGHVGIVTGIDSNGNPIVLSGNHNNTVAEASYSAGRVIAYVWPAG